VTESHKTKIKHFVWLQAANSYAHAVPGIAIEIVVFTVIVNFLMTLRGRGNMLRTDLSIRWFFVGMVFYFLTCLQCAFQTTLPFQRIIHFTDWVVGHAHLVMFGVFGFWMIGAIVYLWPKVVGRPWWSYALNAWTFSCTRVCWPSFSKASCSASAFSTVASMPM